jgi:hypothetical protein
MPGGQPARPESSRMMRRVLLVLFLPALAGLVAATIARSGAFEPSALYVLAPLLVVVGIPLLWLWISWGVAYAGGWHDLAKAYPLRGEIPVAHRWKFQSIQMGLSSYRNSIHVAADSRGLCFWPMTLFRVGNRPICVPWADITASPTKVLWLPMVRLQFARDPRHGILIRRSLADKIRAAFGDAWRVA